MFGAILLCWLCRFTICESTMFPGGEYTAFDKDFKTIIWATCATVDDCSTFVCLLLNGKNVSYVRFEILGPPYACYINEGYRLVNFNISVVDRPTKHIYSNLTIQCRDFVECSNLICDMRENYPYLDILISGSCDYKWKKENK